MLTEQGKNLKKTVILIKGGDGLAQNDIRFSNLAGNSTPVSFQKLISKSSRIM